MEFLQARLSGLWHILRGHRVDWKAGTPEDRMVCAGDIFCHTCNLGIWCRWYDPRWLGGMKCLDIPDESEAERAATRDVISGDSRHKGDF